MSKFTSGKWEYDKEYIFLPNGKWYQPNGFVSDEERQANARLIVAAPEMYELLQESYLALQETDKDEPLRFAIDECLCRITGEIE